MISTQSSLTNHLDLDIIIYLFLVKYIKQFYIHTTQPNYD